MSEIQLYEKIYRTVSLIPIGRVATYGQIAKKAGIGANARLVGYALHRLPDNSDIPWHRVVNAHGRISLREAANLQRFLLEQEGIYFCPDGKIDLNIFCWCE